MKYVYCKTVFFFMTITMSFFLQASFVHAKATRSLITQNTRKIQNDYPQLVEKVFAESIKFGLGYQKEDIYRIIECSQNNRNTSALLAEENDDQKVFEDMIRHTGPTFLFFAIKFSCDGYNLSNETKILARKLIKRYLGCCSCFV